LIGEKSPSPRGYSVHERVNIRVLKMTHCRTTIMENMGGIASNNEKTDKKMMKNVLCRLRSSFLRRDESNFVQSKITKKKFTGF
jgi:hypothetical protein